MAMVGVDSGSLYRRTHSLSRLAWSDGRRPLGAVLHSSNEPGELSQWLCHDDSTINIVLELLIIIILLLFTELFAVAGQPHALRPVYSDTTQLDVELSCVAINGPLGRPFATCHYQRERWMLGDGCCKHRTRTCDLPLCEFFILFFKFVKIC